MKDRLEYLKSVKRLVVKVGTSTIAYPNGLLNLNRIEALARQLTDLHNSGVEILLVTSGAIGVGVGKLGLKNKPKTIPEKQAAAAVGQGILMHMYEKTFSEYGLTVAQILLTKEDITHRKRFLNARNALFSLLNYGVIPIINENDAVAVDEIKIGQNDTLSAQVASLVEADLLVLMSDIDGLYDSNPRENKTAKLISHVKEINPDIEKAAGGTGSSLGTGGMITKILAAKISTSSSIPMVIVNGQTKNILESVFNGENIGTWFYPKEHKLHARKRWIAFGTTLKGKLIVDKGAANALKTGENSLLSSGIIKIQGRFTLGMIVSIVDEEDMEIGRGIVNYSSEEIDLIKGLKSSEIEEKLGYKDYDEVIHINNMVVV